MLEQENGRLQKILVMGHSHLTAPRLAYAEAGDSARGWPAMVFFATNGDQYQPEIADGVLNPAISARLRAEAADLYVSMLGGNDHTPMCLVNDERRYDFVLPEAPELYIDPAAEILPAALLRAELARRMAMHLAMLEGMRAAVPGRMVHIESPPPIASAEFIETNHDGFGHLFAARGVAPALLRYKMWRLHSSLVREACARLGVEFLATPREVLDEQGMLARPAWRDATHANSFYGRHVLAQLLS